MPARQIVSDFLLLHLVFLSGEQLSNLVQHLDIRLWMLLFLVNTRIHVKTLAVCILRVSVRRLLGKSRIYLLILSCL